MPKIKFYKQKSKMDKITQCSRCKDLFPSPDKNVTKIIETVTIETSWHAP